MFHVSLVCGSENTMMMNQLISAIPEPHCYYRNKSDGSHKPDMILVGLWDCRNKIHCTCHCSEQ